MDRDHFSNLSFPQPKEAPYEILAKLAQASSVLEKKIFKGFYHIWAWQPSWSMDRDHFSNLSFPQPKEAPYEILAKFHMEHSSG